MVLVAGFRVSNAACMEGIALHSAFDGGISLVVGDPAPGCGPRAGLARQLGEALSRIASIEEERERERTDLKCRLGASQAVHAKTREKLEALRASVRSDDAAAELRRSQSKIGSQAVALRRGDERIRELKREIGTASRRKRELARERDRSAAPELRLAESRERSEELKTELEKSGSYARKLKKHRFGRRSDRRKSGKGGSEADGGNDAKDEGKSDSNDGGSKAKAPKAPAASAA